MAARFIVVTTIVYEYLNQLAQDDNLLKKASYVRILYSLMTSHFSKSTEIRCQELFLSVIYMYSLNYFQCIIITLVIINLNLPTK